MASNQKSADIVSESAVTALSTAASDKNNKARKRRGAKSRGRKRTADTQNQLSSTGSLWYQSNYLANLATPQPQPLSASKHKLAKQQEQHQQQQQQQRGLGNNKIKGKGNHDKAAGNNNGSNNSNKGKGPTNITNTGFCAPNKPQEPSERNIIYLTNRAKLAAQAELLAEAVPFRLPYGSSA